MIDKMDRHIFIFVFVCLGMFLAQARLILDLRPKVIDVQENRHVIIRCSLDVLQTETNVVYSIMIKRRGMLSAVLFKDGSYDISEKHVTLKNSSISRSSVFLELKLQTITCVDRGDYSCKMAVRRSHRNLQLGPVTASLKVIGEPSGIVLSFNPQRTLYSEGEKVNVTCSTLQKSSIDDWSWIFGNQSRENRFDACAYSDNDCLYKCSSTVQHIASVDDMESLFVCVAGGMSANGILTDVAVTLPTEIYDIVTNSSNGNNKMFTDSIQEETTIVTAVGSVMAVVVIITVVALIFRFGKLKPWKRTDGYSKRNCLDDSQKPFFNDTNRSEPPRKKFQDIDHEENVMLT